MQCGSTAIVWYIWCCRSVCILYTTNAHRRYVAGVSSVLGTKWTFYVANRSTYPWLFLRSQKITHIHTLPHTNSNSRYSQTPTVTLLQFTAPYNCHYYNQQKQFVFAQTLLRKASLDVTFVGESVIMFVAADMHTHTHTRTPVPTYPLPLYHISPHTNTHTHTCAYITHYRFTINLSAVSDV
jgi:hypothetical protein